MPEPPAEQSKSYMPGLDVLRGVAILMVLVYHGLSQEGIGLEHAHHPLQRYFELGQYGVHLFFVLSGFLITGILLDRRNDADYYRNFYMRRILRIVPAYLLMIACLFASHFISWRFVLVALFFVGNIPGVFHTYAEYGPFWSLAVEEQFYLVWPLAVRRLTRRHLATLCVILIVLTAPLRFACLHLHGALADIEQKTWVVWDFFASGALIAIAVRSTQLRPILRKAIAPLIAAGLIGVLLILLVHEPHTVLLRRFWLATVLEPWILLCSGVLLLAVFRPNIASQPWTAPLLFLARISYGLYLCHYIIFALVVTHWHLPATIGPWQIVRFLVETGISVAIASISRNTFEQFFLNLKPKHHPA